MTSQNTAILSGQGGPTGTGLFELFGLLSDSAAQFGNLSPRGFVDTDDNVLIGGLILTGNNSASVLFRAIGPSISCICRFPTRPAVSTSKRASS